MKQIGKKDNKDWHGGKKNCKDRQKKKKTKTGQKNNKLLKRYGEMDFFSVWGRGSPFLGPFREWVCREGISATAPTLSTGKGFSLVNGSGGGVQSQSPESPQQPKYSQL